MNSLRSSFGVDSDEEASFVYPPSPNLFCPICHELYKKPVITKECSHSFCEICLFQIENGLCPLCRRKFTEADIHQNLVLDQLVKELPVYCKYRKNGCNEQLPLVSKSLHEKQCKYGPSKCPHSYRGCSFEGTKLELEEHLRSKCAFEMLKDYISKTETQINNLKQQLEQQSIELKELKRKFLDISDTNGISMNEQKMPTSNFITSVQSMEIPRSASPAISEKDKWDIPGMIVQQTLSGHSRGVTSICYCPLNDLIFTGGHDTVIRVWDNDGLETENSSNIPSGVNLSSSASLPTTIINSKTVPSNYRCVKNLEGHKYTIWALVSYQGKLLFSSGADGTIICWDIIKFELVKTFGPSSGKIYTLELCGDVLLSGGADRKIRVWDIQSFDCKKELNGHNDCIWQLHYVERDNLMYSTSDDKTIKVWNMETLDCVHTLLQPQNPSKLVALAVGSGFICAGTDDCKIKIWDSKTYEYLKTLTEHSWEVWQLVVSDGILFSGSNDHTIKVWDLQTFTCIKTLIGHKGYIHALTLGTNYRLFSGSGDKTIKVWRGFG